MAIAEALIAELEQGNGHHPPRAGTGAGGQAVVEAAH